MADTIGPKKRTALDDYRNLVYDAAAPVMRRPDRLVDILGTIKNVIAPDIKNADDFLGGSSQAVVPPALKAARKRIISNAVAKPPVEKPLHSLINNRREVYHATDLSSAEEILKSGNIRPGTGFSDALFPGVSVSRTPRIKSKANRAVSFILDETKLPKTTPVTEPMYGKTIKVSELSPSQIQHLQTPEEAKKLNELWDLYVTDHGSIKNYENYKNYKNFNTRVTKRIQQEHSFVPSRNFEFENRTHNTPISQRAIKEIALSDEDLTLGMLKKSELLKLAEKFGIPVSSYSTGQTFHSRRAAMGAPKKFVPGSLENYVKSLLAGEY